MTGNGGPWPAVRLEALLATCLLTIAAGLAGELGWKWLSVAAIEVPSDLPSLQAPALIVNAVVPGLGNTFGYFMSFRHRSERSPLLFVGPAALLSCVGLAVSLSQLPASPGLAAVAVTVVITLITPVMTVAVLLARTRLLWADGKVVAPA